jgi:hypothetical protein
MRVTLALLLLLMLGACQDGPANSGPKRDRPYSEHYGGVCSPYASNCW